MNDTNTSQVKVECRSDYLHEALRPNCVAIIVKELVKRIKKFQKTHEIDAIAFRGMSGALIAPIVSFKMGIPLIMVRKSDHSHSGMRIEGYTDVTNVIIIDDVVCTGDTIREMKKMLKFNKIVGMFLYNQGQLFNSKFKTDFKDVHINSFEAMSIGNEWKIENRKVIN
jgi:orotate phosphoribosyltransferase-like protein